MKKIISTLAILAASAVASKASITLGSNAFNNAPGVALGDVAFFLVDVTGTGFNNLSSANQPFVEGESFSSILTFESSVNGSAGDFSFLPNNTVFTGQKTATVLGSTVLISGGFAGVAIGGADNITSGDKFAAVVFASSTTTAILGDTYTVWTDPTWVIPADGSTLTFSTSGTAVLKAMTSTATPLFSGTVVSAGSPVPEPSAFASIAGLAVLGFAASRRRRS